jgi:hypothetical protein
LPRHSQVAANWLADKTFSGLKIAYMDALILGCWQFGIPTVYHFFFVPLTIGLAFLVAVMQTIYYRTENGSGTIAPPSVAVKEVVSQE